MNEIEEPQDDGAPTEPEDGSKEPIGEDAEPAAPATITSPPWQRSTRIAVGIGLAVATVFIFWLLKPVVVTLILAGLIAFVLSFPIGFFERRLRFKRPIAVIVSFLLVAAAIVAIPFIFVPALVVSLGEIDWVELADSVREWLIVTLTDLRMFSFLGFDVDLSGAIDPVLDVLIGREGTTSPGLDTDALLGFLESAFGFTLGLLGGIVGFFVALLTVMIFSVYIALFGGRMMGTLRRLIPEPYKEDGEKLIERVQLMWSYYFRGQLKVAFLTGTMTWIGLWIVGVPGSLALGVVMGILNLIPTIGPILASIPGIIVALVQGSTRFTMSNFLFALLVTGIYVLVQQIESQILAPRILSVAVEINPIVILIGLIVGFNVLGLIGGLISVPVIASAREIMSYLYYKLQDKTPPSWEGPKPG